MIAAIPPANRTSVRVAEPPHLCRVQAATRALCRLNGLSEGDVFSAVIAATELAYGHLIAGGRAGDVELAIVGRKNALSLEVRAKRSGDGGSAAARLTFPSDIERFSAERRRFRHRGETYGA
jgi:hypothetical protein